MSVTVEGLQERLKHLHGPERTRSLIELGQCQADRYWRAGPGNPAALPALNAGIEAFDEAHRYLDPADTLRGMVAAALGQLLGARAVAHEGSERDRETGIHLVEEALSFPSMSSVHRAGLTLMRGQLYVSRVAAKMQGDGLMAAFRAGRSPGDPRDADRAVECFRSVVDGEPVSADIVEMARTMLTIAESVQMLVGGFGQGLGGFDLGRMAEAVGVLQHIQQQGGRFNARPGIVPIPSLFEAEEFAKSDPLTRPVAVVEDSELPAPVVQRARPPVETDVDAVRRKLRELAGDLSARLRANAPRIDVDELVALATTAVHAGGDPLDHLTLAVALCLRAATDDGDGWGDDDGDGWGDDDGDAARAAEHLAAAAVDRLPDEHLPALGALAVRLGRPELIAARLAPVAAALRSAGAEGLAFADFLLRATGEATPPDARAGRVIVAGDAAPWSVAGVGQLLDLAARTAPPVTATPVFVADPRGDREGAGIEAMLLRRTFYPRSVGLGRTIEYVDGAGTADDVRAHLDASLLHLGCGITAAGALALANGTVLDLARLPRVEAGGLVVLRPPRPGDAAPDFVLSADRLLAAGFTGVVGWLRPVPEPVAALMLFVLHAGLAQDGLRGPAAVEAVRAWMRNPGREPLPQLPSLYAAGAAGVDLADPAYWSALAHRGVF